MLRAAMTPDATLVESCCHEDMATASRERPDVRERVMRAVVLRRPCVRLDDPLKVLGGPLPKLVNFGTLRRRTPDTVSIATHHQLASTFSEWRIAHRPAGGAGREEHAVGYEFVGDVEGQRVRAQRFKLGEIEATIKDG